MRRVAISRTGARTGIPAIASDSHTNRPNASSLCFPFRPVRGAREFRAKHREMLGSLAIAVILGFRQPRDWNGRLGEIVGIKLAELFLLENQINQNHGSIAEYPPPPCKTSWRHRRLQAFGENGNWNGRPHLVGIERASAAVTVSILP